MSLEKEPRDYLFVNKKGEKYSTANAWNKWANRAIKLLTGNQQIQLRTLRHIYISHLLKNNDLTRGERKKIAEKMGHTVDTQDKYKWNIEDD
jgi:integrase